MSLLTFRVPNIWSFISFAQILLLFVYFTLNIMNVGEMGVGLPLLAGFVVLASGLLFVQAMQNSITIRWHFLVFLMFVAWVAVRVLLDLQDLYYLKQVTVATTGGILLFFLLGTFARRALDNLSTSVRSVKSIKLILILFILSSVLIWNEYNGKLVRTDILLLDDIDEGYQRPGNFLIMLFILVSFAYIKISSHILTRQTFSLFFWLGVYSVGFVVALISSQIIGSNAATANLAAIYLMSVVISFLAFSKKVRRAFSENRLSLPLSKTGMKKLVGYSVISAIGVLLIAIVVIQVTGFDLDTVRIFGFGEGTNSSVTSRMEILRETGAAQIGYSPIFGNVNVAYLTTGNAGETLHNFIPNIIAELGLVGLVIIVMIFMFVFRALINSIRTAANNEQGFQQSMLNMWLFYVLIFLLLYANISVGKEWPVIWFFVGFSVSVFGLRKYSN